MKRAKIMGITAACALTAALAACAPAPAAKDQGTFDGPQETSAEAASEEVLPEGEFSWTAKSDCTVCHAGEAIPAQQTACAALAEPVTCGACHSDEQALAEAHDGVAIGDKTPRRLKSTEVVRGVCEACHDQEQVSQQTAGCTVLTDDEGLTVNPHDLPNNEDHATIVCADCHKPHSSTPRVDNAQAACKSCHHAGVYECNTCHEKK